ncbi:MAG: hypothetical protein EOO53_05480 [Gammaproteobacteria bacterium]|nr:MAG: hypothetical protein EOO53_05480 [Gammaproteobacteria bacterium]
MNGLYPTTHNTSFNELNLSSSGAHNPIWLVLIGISFLTLYVALSSWLGWVSLHLLFEINTKETSMLTYGAGALSGFMGLFMMRSLFRLPMHLYRSYRNAR